MTDKLITLLASTACILALGMLINFILEICLPDIDDSVWANWTERRAGKIQIAYLSEKKKK
jgi:hypothetical protein